MSELCSLYRSGNCRFLNNLYPGSLLFHQAFCFFLLALLWSWEAIFHPGSVANSFAGCPWASQWQSADFSFPTCTRGVWDQTRDFHILDSAFLESWGGWMGRSASEVSVLHIGVLGEISFETRICCYKPVWKPLGQEIGKPFTKADILFLLATKHWVSG